MFGLERSTEIVEELSGDAENIFMSFGEKARFLAELTKYLVKRRS